MKYLTAGWAFALLLVGTHIYASQSTQVSDSNVSNTEIVPEIEKKHMVEEDSHSYVDKEPYDYGSRHTIEDRPIDSVTANTNSSLSAYKPESRYH